jgi:glutathione S-transferase
MKRIAVGGAGKDVAEVGFAIERFENECKRLNGILEARLTGRDYLCGPGRGEYSLADLACWGYAAQHWWAGLDVSALPNLTAWLDRVGARVRRWLSIRRPPGCGHLAVCC